MRQKSGLTGRKQFLHQASPFLLTASILPLPVGEVGWGGGEGWLVAPLNRDWDSGRTEVYPLQEGGEGSVCPHMDNSTDRNGIQNRSWVTWESDIWKRRSSGFPRGWQIMLRQLTLLILIGWSSVVHSCRFGIYNIFTGVNIQGSLWFSSNQIKQLQCIFSSVKQLAVYKLFTASFLCDSAHFAKSQQQ